MDQPEDLKRAVRTALRAAETAHGAGQGEAINSLAGSIQQLAFVADKLIDAMHGLTRPNPQPPQPAQFNKKEIVRGLGTTAA